MPGDVMTENTDPIYQFGPFLLDTSEQRLLRDDKAIPLPPKVLDTLIELVKNSGHILTKDKLMSAVWGETFVEDSSLTRNISLLRKALKEGEQEKYIETVPKRGYRFVAPVTMVSRNGIAPAVSEVNNLALLAGEQSVAEPAQLNGNPLAPATAVGEFNLLRVAAATLILASVLIGGYWLRNAVRSKRESTAAGHQPIKALALASKVPGKRNSFTKSPEAYRYYTMGYYFWTRRSSTDLAKAMHYFDLAIKQDPNYALAYASLADTYFLDAYFGYGHLSSLKETYNKAKEAATKALEIDDTLPESHIAVGMVKHFERDLSGAEDSFRRAVELDPSSSIARLRFAHFLAATSRIDRAIAELRVAQEIDPTSSTLCLALGNFLFFARQYDESIKYSKLALELNPEAYLARERLAWAYAAEGRFTEAQVEFTTLRQMTSCWLKDAGLAYVAARTGREKDARQLVEQISKNLGDDQGQPLTFVEIAMTMSALGDKEETFQWLQRAVDSKRLAPGELEYCVELDALKSDARFQQLLFEVKNTKPLVEALGQAD
jgi:DNA-binding winged helix-turn-helix (wHTH) protein/tetratricopeptide (TPR) repeat protein